MRRRRRGVIIWQGVNPDTIFVDDEETDIFYVDDAETGPLISKDPDI